MTRAIRQHYYDEFVQKHGSNENDPNAEFFAGHWLNFENATPTGLDAFLAAVNRLPSLGGKLHERESIRYEDPVAAHSSRPWSRTGRDNDDIKGTQGQDKILAREGDDRVHGHGGDDIIFAHHGNDSVYGGSGDDRIYLQKGNDYAKGDEGDDLIYGGSGSDRIRGEDGNDTLYGGSGVYDKIYGNDGDDTLYGGTGEDWLWGSDDNDTCYGGAGDDHLWGGRGNDLLIGGDGDDWQKGGVGNDIILGGKGDDEMHGEGGNDFLACRDGEDWMLGGRGNDTLVTISDAGKPTYTVSDARQVKDTADADDRLTGGRGADTFKFVFQASASRETAAQFADADGKVDWQALTASDDSDYWTNWGGVDKVDDFNYGAGDRIVLSGPNVGVGEIMHYDSNNDGRNDASRVIIESTQDPGAENPALLSVLVFDDALVNEDQFTIDEDEVTGEFEYI